MGKASLPILILSMSTHLKQLFGLSIPSSQHPAIRQLKKLHPTQLHGNKLWASSYLLMHFLQENPLPEGSRILDMGCGWGLLSVFLSKQGHHEITAMDADSHVFPYLQLLQELNQTTGITPLIKRFEELTPEALSQFDVILATDVCFWDEHLAIHEQLIADAIDVGVKTIIYADPARPAFLALAEQCVEEYFAEFYPLEIECEGKKRGALFVIENA